MAIQKEKVLPNGATGNYWKITSVVVDKLGMKCQWGICLFKDQAFSEQAGAVPLAGPKQYAAAVTQEQITGNLLALGYSLIKAKAASMVDHDISGKALATPHVFDADLANGTDV